MTQVFDFNNKKSLEDNVDEYLKTRITTNSPGLAIGVIDKGVKILTKGYGLADIENKIPISTTSSFCIASVSKHIFSFAILLLEENGLLSVNDNVSQYFPELPDNWSQITVHHLLSNQSGIPDFLKILEDNNISEKGITNDMVLELAIQNDLDFVPGSKFSYCNTGFVILALLIERVSKKSIESFMKENIFDVTGMDNSLVYNESKLHIPERVVGYTKEGALLDYGFLTTGCGGIYSSVEDLLLWSNSLDENSIVSQKYFELATTPNIDDYGYGFFIQNYSGYKVIAHPGRIAGFKTLFLKVQETDTTIVILSNGEVPWELNDLAIKIYEFLRKQ